MRELFILISPALWSIKNNLLRLSGSFYKKAFFYLLSSFTFIFLTTKLLNAGIIKLQKLSPEAFNVMLIKGYSLIFIIIFFAQIIDGVIMSLDKFYQSKELEVLLISPVNRMSIFFSRLFEIHLKSSWMLIIFGIPLLASLGLQFQANLAYYFFSFALFIIFSTISVNIGIGITMLLSGIFPAKKLKKIIFSTGIVTVIVAVTLLRVFKPERFVNPELFANTKLFLIGLKTPSFILLPNRWLSETLFNYLNQNYIDTLIFVPLLLLTSYITVFFLTLAYRKYHYRGWHLLQSETITTKGRKVRESGLSRFIKKLVYLKPVERLLSSLDAQRIALVRKDLVYQFHDTKNMQQNLILLSLVIIYLFSIASLPLNWEGYAVKLKYVISFFNLGLILVIMSSLCSKLVYPAIVSEGVSLWITKTSPLKPGKFIWTKFFLLFVPIFLLGQSLTVFSSFFMDIENTLIVLNILTTTLLCFSFVSLAIVFSISDLKNTMKGDEKDEIKTGNVVFMVISVFFILFTLALEAFPLYLYFLKESEKAEFIQKTWFIIGTVVFILLIVNLLVTAVSMHLSIKKFDDIQTG